MATSYGVVRHTPLSSAANMKWGSYNLWRQELTPTINRPVPTGPLLYSDLRTGSCDPRCVRDSYEFARQKCQAVLWSDPGSRTGEYLSCVNKFATEHLRACNCYRGAAPTPAQCSVSQCAQSNAEIVAKACGGVFPNEAARQACFARYASLERDGCGCIPKGLQVAPTYYMS